MMSVNKNECLHYCLDCGIAHPTIDLCPLQAQRANTTLSRFISKQSKEKDAHIRSLEHDNKLMREALEKYSDNGHWQSDGLWCDHGETARTALQKLEVKDE